MTGVGFPPIADDLDDIWEFVAADNPDALDRVVTDILDAIEALVSFPQQGRRRPDLTSRPLRFRRVFDYLAPDEHPLWSSPYCTEAEILTPWQEF